MPSRVPSQAQILIGGDESSDDDSFDERELVFGNGAAQVVAAEEGREEEEVVEEDVLAQRAELIVEVDLLNAIKRGNLPLVERILDMEERSYFSVDSPFSTGWTGLMYAVEQAHPHLARSLVGRGADVNYHYDMFYPLMAAVNKPSLPSDAVLECVGVLVEAGANVNVHDRQHISPLMLAARNGYPAVVGLLCERAGPAYINKQDQRGWTALMYAAERNLRPVVDTLLSHHASLHIHSVESQSAADIARSCGHTTLFTHLDALICGPGITPPTHNAASACVPPPGAGKIYKQGELDMFLASINLESLCPLFREQGVDMAALLNMNQRDLERLGVTQVGVQARLLEKIRALRGTEFEMPDMSQTLYSLQLNCRDTAKVLKVYCKHLRYMSQTARYLVGQVTESQKLAAEYSTNAVEDSGVLENYQAVLRVVSGLQDSVEEMGEVLCERVAPAPPELEEALWEARRRGEEGGGGGGAVTAIVGLVLGAAIAFTATAIRQHVMT